MENFICMKESEELKELSKQLGYISPLFIGTDFVFVEGNSKKELLHKITVAKQKKLKTLYLSENEEMLRFALEKTPIDMVLGVEKIHPKDSVHHLRGGLDQVLCKIAAANDKTIAFSFGNILNSTSRGKLLGRMMFNSKLCKKYKIKTLFSTFAKTKEELRSAKDLQAFWKVLEKGK